MVHQRNIFIADFAALFYLTPECTFSTAPTLFCQIFRENFMISLRLHYFCIKPMGGLINIENKSFKKIL